LEHSNGESLKQGGEPAASFGPRDADLVNAVSGTIHSRYSSRQHRLKLAGVEVSPASLISLVISRSGCSTLRANETGIGSEVQGHHDFLPSGIDLDLVHKPRLFETENGLIQLSIVHELPPLGGSSS
jgi:hypothetical protein